MSVFFVVVQSQTAKQFSSRRLFLYMLLSKNDYYEARNEIKYRLFLQHKTYLLIPNTTSSTWVTQSCTKETTKSFNAIQRFLKVHGVSHGACLSGSRNIKHHHPSPIYQRLLSLSKHHHPSSSSTLFFSHKLFCFFNHILASAKERYSLMQFCRLNFHNAIVTIRRFTSSLFG